MARQDDETRGLQDLLHGEISAVETYRQAVDKVGNDPGAAELRQIQADHVRAVELLRDEITVQGDVPDRSSGAWGAFARTVQGTANIFGDKSALKALKEGEEHGIKQYESTLRDGDAPARLSSVIRDELLPQQRRHVSTLDRLIDRV